MLTDRQQAILTFENTYRTHTGNKEAGIRDTFGLSSSRYYQILNQLIGLPDALKAEPMLVRGLLNAREMRSRRQRLHVLG